MWPLISSFRIASACSAASSGVSANFTPPAFIRPPVSTWDLITTGPPISSAAARASSGVVQKPYLVTGMPASSTILRASYSKNLIGGAPYTANRNNAWNVSHLRAIAALALIGVLGACSLAGCGGGTDVDYHQGLGNGPRQPRIEARRLRHPGRKRRLPEGVKVEPGTDFECTVATPTERSPTR